MTKVLVVIYQFAGPFLLFYLLFISFLFFFEPTVCVSVCVCVRELWSVHMCEGVVLSMLVSIIRVHVDKQSKLFGRQRKKKHTRVGKRRGGDGSLASRNLTLSTFAVL